MTHSLERTGPSAAAARPEPKPDKAANTASLAIAADGVTGGGPSAAADVVGPPAAARPEPKPDKAAHTASLAIAADGVTGGPQKEGAHQNNQQTDAEVVVADDREGEHQNSQVMVADDPEVIENNQHQNNELQIVKPVIQRYDPEVIENNQHQNNPEVIENNQHQNNQLQLARPQIVKPVIQRFAPVKDVKTMLQTGLLEGKRITYRNKKDKIDMLHGVIKGSAYFCLCGGSCDKTGKELSAKSFELHAKGESHNPNDHIYPHLVNMSLFDMSKKLKEAKDSSELQTIFNGIMPKDLDHCRKKVTAANETSEDCLLILEWLEFLEKKVEQRIEQIQSQVNTIEQNVDFLVNETVRSRKLFEEVAKVFGKLGDI